MDLRDLIVFAHGGGALIDHDDLMFLFPMVPFMLVGTIVAAVVLRKLGLLGEQDRTIALPAALASVASALSLGAAAMHFAVTRTTLRSTWPTACSLSVWHGSRQFGRRLS